MKRFPLFSLVMTVLIFASVLVGCGGGGGGGKNPSPNVSYEIYASESRENVGTLLKSTDGGNTFTVINSLTVDFSSNPSHIFQIFVSENSIYLATNVGLAISTDNGATFDWFLQGESVKSIYVSGTTIFAGVIGHIGSSRLAVTHDGGQNWTDLLISYEINTVYGLGNIICVSTTNGLAISTDSGENFTIYTHSESTDSLADNAVNGVWVSDGLIYAATNNGLSISDDNGVTFDTELSGTMLGAIGVSGSNVYTTSFNIATESSELLISHDGGDSFTSKAISGLSNPYFIFLSGSTVYVTGGGSGVAVSYDNGNSFTSVSGLNGLEITGLFAKAILQ